MSITRMKLPSSSSYKKGQVTMINLFAVLITLILYFAFLPVLQPMIATAKAYMLTTTNDFKDILNIVLDMVPFVMILSIIMTALNYAIPQREGR